MVVKIFLISLFWLIFACENPFATREIEEPVRSRSNREIPSDPEIVLTNLQEALASRNVNNYMSCLTSKSELFQFIPDEFVKKNNPGVFENWPLEAERNYIHQISNFVPIDSLIRLNFEALSDIISDEVFADSALLRRKYYLQINHTLPGKAPRVVEGISYFWIFKEEGYWFIHKWTDFGTKNQRSWSDLKAGFGK